MFGSGRPNWTTPPTSFHLSNIEGADLKQEQATQTEVLQTPSAVLCDTNRYWRNIGIEIENFRYFRYRIGIGIERGVIRGIGIGIGIVRRVSEVLVLVSVL